MGYQLWTSPLTGYRRKGTKFTALKELFVDNVTAKSIYEPLLCCPMDSNPVAAKEALSARDFDVAGVKLTNDGSIIGYVVAEEIGDDEFKNYLKEFEFRYVISDSTPLTEIFAVLSTKNYAFVVYGNEIIGIITKADINKPPVRIYVFGVISLLEMHLNSWINYYYPRSTWLDRIDKNRMEAAAKTYEQRKGDNQELSILECLQFCDKRDLLLSSDGFLKMFVFSKSKFKSFIKRAEKIRNQLAHSQNSIISNMKWSDFIGTISLTEKFLMESDTAVERIAKEGLDFQDLLI